MKTTYYVCLFLALLFTFCHSKALTTVNVELRHGTGDMSTKPPMYESEVMFINNSDSVVWLYTYSPTGLGYAEIKSPSLVIFHMHGAIDSFALMPYVAESRGQRALWLLNVDGAVAKYGRPLYKIQDSLLHTQNSLERLRDSMYFHGAGGSYYVIDSSFIPYCVDLNTFADTFIFTNKIPNNAVEAPVLNHAPFTGTYRLFDVAGRLLAKDVTERQALTLLRTRGVYFLQAGRISKRICRI